MNHLLRILAIVVLASMGCKKGDSKSALAGSGSAAGSATTPGSAATAGSATTPGSAAKPDGVGGNMFGAGGVGPSASGAGRPAAITDELLKLSEEMIVALSDLGARLAKIDDCKQVAAAITASQAKVNVISDKIKLHDFDKSNTTANNWVEQHLAPRINAAFDTIGTSIVKCGQDPDVASAVELFVKSLGE